MVLRQIEVEKPMEQVNIRLPGSIRAKAKRLAEMKQTDEAKVLRSIIQNFFDMSDTDCIDKKKQSVSDGGVPEPQA